MPTKTLEFSKLFPDRFPLTVTYFDANGAEVWTGTLDAPGTIEAPVYGPGRVRSVRVEYADGTYEDESVDTPEQIQRKRRVRRIVLLIAVGIAGIWLAYGVTSSGDEGRRQADDFVWCIEHMPKSVDCTTWKR